MEELKLEKHNYKQAYKLRKPCSLCCLKTCWWLQITVKANITALTTMSELCECSNDRDTCCRGNYRGADDGARNPGM